MKSSVVVLLAALCLTVNFQPGAVMDVVDGDTFDLYHVGVPAKERIRVLGVDTPERGKPNAAEATAFTTAWLQRGPFDMVTCKRDSFGRMLGAISRNGERLDAALIAAGLGIVR